MPSAILNQLGNEIQGPAHDGPAGHVHKGLAAPFHAQQFVTLSKMIDEIWGAHQPKIAGPDQNPCCANWTTLFLQTLKAENVTLDAFTYHSYDGHKNDHEPGVLNKELFTPEFLSTHIKSGTKYKALIDAESPGSELWVGEFADCAGSGVPGVSDSFEVKRSLIQLCEFVSRDVLPSVLRVTLGYYRLRRRAGQP